MPFQLPPNAFSGFQLNHQEQEQLQQEIDFAINNTVSMNTKFELHCKGREGGPSAARYKFLKSTQNLKVYKDRYSVSREKPNARGANSHQYSSDMLPELDPTLSQSSVYSNEHELEHSTSSSSYRPPSTANRILSSRPQHLPWVLASGNIEGTLDDFMFGNFADNDAKWRFRNAVLKEKFDDSKVISTVYGPNARDPHRFLAIKWFTPEMAGPLNYMVQRRDFIIIDGGGMLREDQKSEEDKGRRVGYYAFASFQSTRLPELGKNDAIRGNLGFWFLMKERKDNRVEIFSRGFIDMKGQIMSSLPPMMAADSITANDKMVDCGNLKKLIWLLDQKRSQNNQRESLGDDRRFCQSCGKEPNRIFSAPYECKLCGCIVCKKCVQPRKIPVDVSTKQVVWGQMVFCVECIVRANKTSAREVAKAMYTKNDQREHLSIANVGDSLILNGSRE